MTLKNLSFSTVQAPKNARNSMNTKDRARAKFLANVNTQISAVDAFIAGETGYFVTKKRYTTDEDGSRRRVNRDIGVRPWWFEIDGQFFITARYGNRPLELAKGKPSIGAGDSLDSVHDVLVQVRDAVEALELDKVLEKAADEVRHRLSKK